jgi:hypothetical protein
MMTLGEASASPFLSAHQLAGQFAQIILWPRSIMLDDLGGSDRAEPQ